MSKLKWTGIDPITRCFPDGIPEKYHAAYPHVIGHIHISLQWRKNGYDKLLQAYVMPYPDCDEIPFDFQSARRLFKAMENKLK